MKIVVVATLNFPNVIGGAEISTQLLCESLVNLGHSVTVITTTKEKGYFQEINGVNIYYLENRNVYWKYPSRDKSSISKFVYHSIDVCNIFYAGEIFRIVKKVNPDVIHTQNLCGLSVWVWNIARRLKIPLIHTLRDYYLLCPKQTMTSKSGNCTTQCTVCRFYSFPKRILSESVDAVVGISQFILQRHLVMGFFSRSILLKNIPNSVKMSKGGLGSAKKQIGFIGRISEEKGVEFLIESFLSTKNQQYTLVIAGKGNDEYYYSLRKKYSSDNVKFLGMVNSDDFYQTIDLLVVPSLWDEPFGRVVIEAFSFGLPVFVSDKGGLPELISEITGRVFSIESTTSLTLLLLKFFNDEIVFSRKDIIDVVEQKFSMKSIARQYEELYINVSNVT